MKEDTAIYNMHMKRGLTSLTIREEQIKTTPRGLPWWSSGLEFTMHGTRAPSQPGNEDPACDIATMPVCHSWARTPGPVLCNQRSHHSETPKRSNEDPVQPKQTNKKKASGKKLQWGTSSHSSGWLPSKNKNQKTSTGEDREVGPWAL